MTRDLTNEEAAGVHGNHNPSLAESFPGEEVRGELFESVDYRENNDLAWANIVEHERQQVLACREVLQAIEGIAEIMPADGPTAIFMLSQIRVLCEQARKGNP